MASRTSSVPLPYVFPEYKGKYLGLYLTVRTENPAVLVIHKKKNTVREEIPFTYEILPESKTLRCLHEENVFDLKYKVFPNGNVRVSRGLFRTTLIPVRLH